MCDHAGRLAHRSVPAAFAVLSSASCAVTSACFCAAVRAAPRCNAAAADQPADADADDEEPDEEDIAEGEEEDAAAEAEDDEVLTLSLTACKMYVAVLLSDPRWHMHQYRSQGWQLGVCALPVGPATQP